MKELLRVPGQKKNTCLLTSIVPIMILASEITLDQKMTLISQFMRRCDESFTTLCQGNPSGISWEVALEYANNFLTSNRIIEHGNIEAIRDKQYFLPEEIITTQSDFSEKIFGYLQAIDLGTEELEAFLKINPGSPEQDTLYSIIFGSDPLEKMTDSIVAVFWNLYFENDGREQEVLIHWVLEVERPAAFVTLANGHYTAYYLRDKNFTKFDSQTGIAQEGDIQEELLPSFTRGSNVITELSLCKPL